MKRRRHLFALLALGSSACRDAAPRLPKLTRMLLDCSANEPEASTATVLAEQRLWALARNESKAPFTVRDVAATIFESGHFEREVDSTELEFVLLASVLAGRRGSCVGLGTLALAVAELNGVALEAVLLPGHFYVRAAAGPPCNLELLRRGEDMPNRWYQERYPFPSNARAYGRALQPHEICGVVSYNIGNQRRRQGRLVEAQVAYREAARRFPDLAEAHAGLGAVLHLVGELQGAAVAYQAAAAANPGLTGLAANVELLEAERRSAKPTAEP